MVNTVLKQCNEYFLSTLKQFEHASKFWLAYSGGVDSTVLLSLFYSNKDKINHDIEVVHVNHGLYEEAESWCLFCQKQCEQYRFHFTPLSITIPCPKGESIEAWARDQRYQLIEQQMGKGDVLFTAHHQDDQIETFFLQALRGAGPRGLAAMPLVKKKRNVIHARPLLAYTREELEHYAKTYALDWQDDKSNFDSRYDRNYFRQKLIPLIKKRWPAYRTTLSRLIAYQKETRSLLTEVATTDLDSVKQNGTDNLLIDAIKRLSIGRQKNLIFFWLAQRNLQSPGSKHIEQIITDIINSSVDKSPCVNWGNVEVRRYKKVLYAGKAILDFKPDETFNWLPGTSLAISNEILYADLLKGVGITKHKVERSGLVVKFRQGGEKIRLDSSGHSKTVKQLFQEHAVLPWYRDRIPLIYFEDELIAIPGICVNKKYMAEQDDDSWDIHWTGYAKAIQT